MPKTPPYMRFFPSDWRGGVSGLTSHEIGVYIQLCCAIFEGGGHVVDDRKYLARIWGCTPAYLGKAIDTLIGQGKIIADDQGLTNNRVVDELTHAVTRSKSAAVGANERWQKDQQKQQTGDANAFLTHPKNDANQNQNQNQSKVTPIPPTPEEIAEAAAKAAKAARDTALRAEFARGFWPIYPNKVGRPKAETAYLRARGRAGALEIEDGLRRYVATKPPDRKWLNPATFLNQDRWNDQPAIEESEPSYSDIRRAAQQKLKEMDNGRSNPILHLVASERP